MILPGVLAIISAGPFLSALKAIWVFSTVVLITLVVPLTILSYFATQIDSGSSFLMTIEPTKWLQLITPTTIALLTLRYAKRALLKQFKGSE